MERTLSSASFSNEQDIRESTEAVKKLHHVMRQELSQGVHVMQAVTDQNANFAKLSFNFGTKLKVTPSDSQYAVHHHCVDHFLSLSLSFSPSLLPSLSLSLSQTHLCTIFSHKATLLLEQVTHRSTANLPSLISHQPLHNDLRSYTELTHWMKECENSRFIEVCEVSSSLFNHTHFIDHTHFITLHGHESHNFPSIGVWSKFCKKKTINFSA